MLETPLVVAVFLISGACVVVRVGEVDDFLNSGVACVVSKDAVWVDKIRPKKECQHSVKQFLPMTPFLVLMENCRKICKTKHIKTIKIYTIAKKYIYTSATVFKMESQNVLYLY